MAEPRARRPMSDNARRAQKLLVGGLVGGHAAALVVVAAFWLLSGPTAAASAAIACVITLAFYTIALGVQVAVADAPPKTVLVAWLGSYLSRVTVLGLLLALTLTNAARWPWLDPVAVVVGTIGVVLGWLGNELRAYSKLRIPVFDPPPSHDG